MGKKTTKTTNDPWAPAQPLILKSLNATSQTYDANQPQLQKYANMQQDAYGRLAPGAEAGIMGSQSLVNDTLSGKYLNGNPHLQGMIDSSNRDITDGVNGQFEMSGRYGSGKHAGVLADSLAKNENALRYGDYSQERAYQNNAVGQAQGLMGGATSLLNNAADLPWVGTAALSGGIRQSSNGYGTQTSVTKDPWGTIVGLAGAAASGASAAASGGAASDLGVKNISHQVGTTPDGLPIYDFTYKGDPKQTHQIGPIAQEVEQVRPDAMEPDLPGGVKAVNYGKLGLPNPTVAPDGSPTDPITPQALPKVHDRSAMGILNGFVSPDPTTTWGKIGILGQHLMASEGSPLQGLGQGLLGATADAQKLDDNKAERNLKEIQALAAYRTANKPQYHTVGDDLVATPVDGGPASVAYHGTPKAAATPFGFTTDPDTGLPKALPGFLTPADKEAEQARRDDARAAHSDARQAATFAHSDEMQARSLKAIASRMSAGTTTPLPTGTIDYLASRFNATGGELPQLGLGKAGSAMKAAIVNRAVELEAAAGHTGADGAAAKVAFGGQKAGARAVGTMTGKIDYGINELSGAIPLALRASSGIPRGNFVPFTQATQMVQRGNSDPALKDFSVKTQGVINAYNVFAARAGSSVDERRHNTALLQTADSPAAYQAALKAMQQEATVAKNASHQTLSDISGARQSGPMKGQVVKGYRFLGGNPADKASWAPAR